MRGFFRLLLVVICIPIAGVLIGLSAFLLQRYYSTERPAVKEIEQIPPTPFPTPTAVAYKVHEVSRSLLLQQASQSAAMQFLDNVSSDITSYSQKKNIYMLANTSVSIEKRNISSFLESQADVLAEIEENMSHDEVLNRSDKRIMDENIKKYIEILNTQNRVIKSAKNIPELKKVVSDNARIELYSFAVVRLLYMYEFLHIKNRLLTTREIMKRIEKTIENEKKDGEVDVVTIEEQYSDVMIRLDSLDVAVGKNYEEVKDLSVDDSYNSVFARIKSDNTIIIDELSALRLDLSRLRVLFEDL